MKKGDLVLCINASGGLTALTLGRIYRVVPKKSHDTEDLIYIRDDKDRRAGCYPHRFVPLTGFSNITEVLFD